MRFRLVIPTMVASVALLLWLPGTSHGSGPNQDSVVTFYYRQSHDVMGGLGLRKAPIVVDGKVLTKLKKDTFFSIPLPPGDHTFRAKKGQAFTLALEQGRHYYVRVATHKTMTGNYTTLVAMCPESGRSESGYVRLEEAHGVAGALSLEDRREPAPQETEDPVGQPLLTAYRPRIDSGSILNTSVFIDGAEVADLDNGTFVQLRLPAGHHEFRSDQAKDAFRVDLEPGKEYFMRIELVFGAFKGHGRGLLVDRERATSEFQWSTIKYAKDVRDARVLPSGEALSVVPSVAASTDLPASGGEKAHVTVYFPRPEYGPTSASGHFGTRGIYLDDSKIAALGDGRYFTFDVEPGIHRFGYKKKSFELELAPGRNHFLRLDFDGSFYPVCEEQGISEATGGMMQPIKPDKIESR